MLPTAYIKANRIRIDSMILIIRTSAKFKRFCAETGIWAEKHIGQFSLSGYNFLMYQTFPTE